MSILGWAAFALACSAFLLPVVNPDIYWHLSAGKYTVSRLGPPRTDFLSWPLQGAPWVNFEWLSQVVYYLLYAAGGFRALQVFKALLLVLTLLVLRRSLLLHAGKAVLPVALPFIAAGLLSNCDLRPENFTLLFFALTMYALEKARLSEAPPGRLAPAAAAVFFALWANLHAGYLYGLALIGLYSAGELLTEQLPYIYGQGPLVKPGRSLAYLKCFLAGLAASLANPYGWKIYAVIMDHQKHIATLQEHIQEWGTFSLLNAYQWPYVIMLAAAFIGAAFFLLKKKHVVFHHFAALLFFAWAAANHARHIPFFIMTGAVFTAALPWKGMGKGARRTLVSAGALLLLGLAWFYPALIWSQYSARPRTYRWASDGAAAFLRANKAELAGLRMYNHWGWGGWLGWELGPEYKPFIDGRYLFHDRIPEITGLKRDARGWRDLIKKYDFELALIKPDQPLVPMKQSMPGKAEEVFWRPAYMFFMPRSEWAVVYWDYSIMALVRRRGVPAGWLKEHELRYLRPGDTHNLPEALASGAMPLSALRAEFGIYRKNHLSGHDKAAGADVEKLAAELERFCEGRGGGCAK